MLEQVSSVKAQLMLGSHSLQRKTKKANYISKRRTGVDFEEYALWIVRIHTWAAEDMQVSWLLSLEMIPLMLSFLASAFITPVCQSAGKSRGHTLCSLHFFFFLLSALQCISPRNTTSFGVSESLLPSPSSGETPCLMHVSLHPGSKLGKSHSSFYLFFLLKDKYSASLNDGCADCYWNLVCVISNHLLCVGRQKPLIKRE